MCEKRANCHLGLFYYEWNFSIVNDGRSLPNFRCFFRDYKCKKMTEARGVWRFFHVFYTDDMKCDTSVNEKTGCFGTDLSHLTYQNLEYEGCVLGTCTWSHVMSRNSFHHRWNDWLDETMLHRPPYHGFQLCLFIVKAALQTPTN